jgi:hypothetical protein
MIDTEAPFSHSPAALCKTDALRLALERPPWSTSMHQKFPARFRQAAQLLLLMGSNAPNGSPPVVAAKGEEAESSGDLADGDQQNEVDWQLPRDVVLCILPLMAYPISAWVQEGDFEPPEFILR